jgi:hypothetical protein
VGLRAGLDVIRREKPFTPTGNRTETPRRSARGLVAMPAERNFYLFFFISGVGAMSGLLPPAGTPGILHLLK